MLAGSEAIGERAFDNVLSLDNSEKAVTALLTWQELETDSLTFQCSRRERRQTHRWGLWTLLRRNLRHLAFLGESLLFSSQRLMGLRNLDYISIIGNTFYNLAFIQGCIFQNKSKLVSQSYKNTYIHIYMHIHTNIHIHMCIYVCI